MNTQNPFIGRFVLVLLTVFAAGSVACGAAPEAGGSAEDTEVAETNGLAAADSPVERVRPDAGPSTPPSGADESSGEVAPEGQIPPEEHHRLFVPVQAPREH